MTTCMGGVNCSDTSDQISRISEFGKKQDIMLSTVDSAMLSAGNTDLFLVAA